MPTKRIYIDSRFRLPGGTDSDFRYALKTPIEIPRGTIGWIDGVVISHSFNTVIQGHNDRLFVREVYGASYHDRGLTIPAGDYNGYSLASTSEALLNIGTSLPQVWTVTFESGMLTFANGTPAASGGGYVLPREIVESPNFQPVWGHMTTPAPPPLSLDADASRLIGNLRAPAIAVNSVQSFTPAWIDLLPYHQLFLQSHWRSDVSGPAWGEHHREKDCRHGKSLRFNCRSFVDANGPNRVGSAAINAALLSARCGGELGRHARPFY